MGIDKPVAENEEEITAPLDPQAVLGALQDALLADLAKPDGAYADDLADTLENASEHQRSLFAKNFGSILGLLRREMKNIEEGTYRLPYDLDPREAGILNTRQWNPLNVAVQADRYVRDRTKVLERRDRKDGLELRRTFPVQPNSKKYPDYFLQNFHYQSDGWLSSRSAQLYDYQVESLFLGMADAMRRQILPEFKAFMDTKYDSDVKLLDVASGTGRFVSFVLDNHRTLDTTVSDLSPFYLQEARTTLHRFRQVKFVEAAVEALPFEDESFDAITCVYLFHELPREVRHAALQEFLRVLKPGGRLFFVDSAQKGEVPYERVLKGFTIIAHEPYYLDYVEMDLSGPSGMMAEIGFDVTHNSVHWVSKCVVAVKPDPSTAATTASTATLTEDDGED